MAHGPRWPKSSRPPRLKRPPLLALQRELVVGAQNLPHPVFYQQVGCSPVAVYPIIEIPGPYGNVVRGRYILFFGPEKITADPGIVCVSFRNLNGRAESAETRGSGKILRRKGSSEGTRAQRWGTGCFYEMAEGATPDFDAHDQQPAHLVVVGRKVRVDEEDACGAVDQQPQAVGSLVPQNIADPCCYALLVNHLNTAKEQPGICAVTCGSRAMQPVSPVQLGRGVVSPASACYACCGVAIHL